MRIHCLRLFLVLLLTLLLILIILLTAHRSKYTISIRIGLKHVGGTTEVLDHSGQ